MADRGRGVHKDMDRGWAWVIALAVASYNVMMGGTLKSYGLFYVEFIHWFTEGPAAVGLISLVFGISGIIFAPLGGRLSDSVSPRLIVLVGGLVLSAGFSLTSLAPNLVTAIVTYGCFAGGAIGLIDGPILSYLGHYFRRKRNLASGIVWMGSSVGNMALAPLFSFLIAEYGIKGTLILLGGIWTHTCIIALLLRPPPPDGSTKQQETLYEDSDLCESNHNDISKAAVEEEYCENEQQNKVIENVNNGISQTENGKSLTTHLNSEDKGSGRTRVPADGATGHPIPEVSDGTDTAGMVVENNQKYSAVPENEINANRILLMDQDTEISSKYAENDQNISNKQKYAENDQNISNKSQQCLAMNVQTSTPDVVNQTYGQFLRNAGMWRVILTLGCGFYGYYTPIICFPAWGEELAFSRFQVAALVSVVGAVEIVARVLLGYIADRPGVSLSTLLTASYIIMGVAGQVAVLLASFPCLMVYAVLHGLLGGTAHVLMASLVFRTVPVDWFGSATGLAVVQLHIMAASASPTGGLMKELTGSYRHIVQVSSGIYILGALFYNIGPIIAKVRSRSRLKSASRS